MAALNKSDRHRIVSPAVAALVLAALRLKLHVSKSDVTGIAELIEVTYNKESPRAAANSAEAETKVAERSEQWSKP